MSFVFGNLYGVILRYANGPNDNFQSAATLWGSGATSCRRALTSAILTTGPGSAAAGRMPRVLVGSPTSCDERYRGRVSGIEAHALLDRTHFATSGLVSFPRGLKDTPKIVAILPAASALGKQASAMAVAGIAMEVEGLLHSMKIADKISFEIQEMNHGQGFTTNLITSMLVIFASRLGFPVSTTHVSCGALFGIGMSNGKAYWRTIAGILLAWVITLPVAALLGIAIFKLTREMTG